MQRLKKKLAGLVRQNTDLRIENHQLKHQLSIQQITISSQSLEIAALNQKNAESSSSSDVSSWVGLKTKEGIVGVIVGRALYEGTIELRHAQKLADSFSQ